MEYKYDIVRSVRKTLSVSVSSENKITVHAPWNVSETRIEEFLNSKKIIFIHSISQIGQISVGAASNQGSGRSMYFLK